VRDDADPSRLRQEDAAVSEFELLGIRIAEAAVLPLLAERRKARAALEEVRERPVQIVDRLLQRMVRHFVEEIELTLEVRELLHLVVGRKLTRLAALLLQDLLIQAKIVHQPAAADRSPEELFLGGVRIDSEAVGLLQQHGDKPAQPSLKDASRIRVHSP
jgi:thymidine phosphorylase